MTTVTWLELHERFEYALNDLGLDAETARRAAEEAATAAHDVVNPDA